MTSAIKLLKKLGRRKEHNNKRSSSSNTLSSSALSDGVFSDDLFKLVLEAADDKMATFRNSLSPSLNQFPHKLQIIQEDQSEQDFVAPFQADEIVLGPKLGCGEFGIVYELQSFNLQPDMEVSSVALEKRLRMKKCEKYRDTENARYALKHIKETYLLDNGSDLFVQAAGDLALEAEFLAKLNHPNIIKLRGLALSGVSGYANGPCGYFLIIDRLFETLDQRIRRWHHPSIKERIMHTKSTISNSINASRRSSIDRNAGGDEVVEASSDRGRVELMDGCLSVALQLSAAMVYLHSHSVIFRDLKPANVGFDVRGDLKIFDFGLARIVPRGDIYNDLYEMSGAGSPRYMAPECMRMEEYNLKADVYSFSIVVWEILSGDAPYGFVRSRDELYHHVLEKNGRPEIDKRWPSDIKGMLESSFDVDPEKRPKMQPFYDIIKNTLVELRGGDQKGLTNSAINQRRSVW
eukprot:CAMPEP_0183751474 /NCGR_PEP_ID=MMETSP0739-20130205/1755_1 /TAXON_ID=385413 /ORGANISM="Thalassiosira miniscula, Strain CCMP1093" /LENGTH=462 /DNA_ID=CAMNT_0025987703 /DNA_START=32 /DNA_END=1417 /DNA_ORIENTATION=-